MSSAILYVAIVAIWAVVLIPRWLRRDSAASERYSEDLTTAEAHTEPDAEVAAEPAAPPRRREPTAPRAPVRPQVKAQGRAQGRAQGQRQSHGRSLSRRLRPRLRSPKAGGGSGNTRRCWSRGGGCSTCCWRWPSGPARSRSPRWPPGGWWCRRPSCCSATRACCGRPPRPTPNGVSWLAPAPPRPRRWRRRDVRPLRRPLPRRPRLTPRSSTSPRRSPRLGRSSSTSTRTPSCARWAT